MTTRTVTYVFCDRCNPGQMVRARGMVACDGKPEATLRRLGWRRFWLGGVRKNRRPIECAECIADGKAAPAPMFAAGGAS